MMGEPTETRHTAHAQRAGRHLPVLVASTPACGTSNYTFIWGMCGENQEFDDMDNIDPMDLR